MQQDSHGENKISGRDFSIVLLGEPHWRLNAHEVQALSAKDAALIALLALHGPQARDVLAGQLWPSSTQQQASSSMRQRITRLRHRSGHELFHTGPSVSLVDDVTIDLHAVATLDVDALLNAGELLAGCEFAGNEFLETWLREQRERLRRERADALAGHAEAFQRQGQLAAALRLAERVVALAPLLEHAWRRLMRLHYLRADRSAAIEAFERFEALLREQTGTRPGAETLALLDTIERSASPDPSARGVVPVSLVRPPQRIGRERQWLAMTRAWSAGRAFVIIGDAGIGKSRMLNDLAQDRPGALAERGRPGDAQTPYAVLGRLLQAVSLAHVPEPAAFVRGELSRIAAGFGTAPQAPGQQAALWHAAELLLQAASAAGLTALLVDDLHFADIATLEAMRWLSASQRLADLRMGFASRSLDSGPMAELMREWLDDSQRPERIELPNFSAAEVGALLAALGLPQLLAPGIAERLFAHAGGHPLFTLETLKDAWLHDHDLAVGALPSPTTVQDLLDHRLRELPAEALDLLRVAAIGGADLTPERAARLLGCSVLDMSSAWVRLENANVMQGPRFTHDLVHEGALRQVPEAVRQHLHAAWAGVLSDDPSVPASHRAGHWQAARRWAEAGACWHEAGMAARRAGRLVEQHALLERAADCCRQAGDATGEFDALHGGFDSLLLRHGGKATLAALPRLQALARSAEQHLKCLLIEAESLIDTERHAEAAELAASAVQAARQSPAWLADALSLQGMALVQCGRADAAIAAARGAVDVAQRAGQVAQQMRAARSLAYVLYVAGRLAESVPAQRQTRELADALGDQAEAAAAEGNVAALLGVLGDVPASHAHALDARRRYLAMGLSRNSTLAGMNLVVLGVAAAYLGRFDEALAALLEAQNLAGEELGASARAKARISLAGLWLTLGCSHLARPLVRDLPDEVQPGMRMQAEWLLARAETMDGRSGAAHAERLATLMARHPSLPLVQSAWIEWSCHGDALHVIDRLRAVQAECDQLGLPGTARTLRLREIDRSSEIDTPHAIAAAAVLARALLPHIDGGMSSKTYPPEAWLILARAFERARDAVAAQDCRVRARQWILERALPRVPEPYKDSFLRLNPCNRQALEGRG